MLRAGIYCRISKDRIGAGLGVGRQEDDCRELAARNDWNVAEVYVDNDLSAYTGKPRPAYRKLLDDIGRGAVDVVLAWHTDRLHRSPTELEEYIAVCEPRGVPTVTVKAGPLDLATPSGRMVARQLGAVARYEVEHQIERQRSAKAQAAADGRWKGGRRPYGYAADGMTLIEQEVTVVRELAARVLAGDSMRSMAAELNARGLTTSTGAPWRQDAVRAVLLRPRNAGLMEHRGEVIGPASWSPLLDEDTWRAVVSILTDPDRRTTIPGRRWLLSGLAKCGKCGGDMYATLMASKRAAGNVPAYTCKASRDVVRNAGELEAFVTSVVIERLSRPDAVTLLRTQRQGPDLAELHVRAVVLRERLDGLAVTYADGGIDARQLREGSDRLRRQLEQVQTAIGEASRGSVLAGLVDAPDVAQVWATLGLDRRRAVIDTLMTVTVNKTRRGRRPGWRAGESYFDPRNIEIEWK